MALAMLGMRFVQVEELDQDNNRQTVDAIEAMRAAETSYEDVLRVYRAERPLPPAESTTGCTAPWMARLPWAALMTG